MLRVAMFSGGSGTASIARALVDTLKEDVSLMLIVNCYDDGLSTGAIRKAIPGMLGPSDVRKNVARFTTNPVLGELLERRVHTDSIPSVPGAVGRYALTACEYLKLGGISIPDCAYGNLVFAGIFLSHFSDFNTAVWEFQQVCRSSVRVINVSDGESLHLCALRANDEIVYDEAKISTEAEPVPITELSFTNKKQPKLNQYLYRELSHADLIVYGPGTQHSSLLPSYMTVGLAEVISSMKVPKVYIANLVRDKDTPTEMLGDLLGKFYKYTNRLGGFLLSDFVTHVVGPYVEGFPDLTFSIGDYVFSDVPGVHNGPQVVDYLLSLVNRS